MVKEKIILNLIIEQLMLCWVMKRDIVSNAKVLNDFLILKKWMASKLSLWFVITGAIKKELVKFLLLIFKTLKLTGVLIVGQQREFKCQK